MIQTVNKINETIGTDFPVIHERIDARVWEIFGQGELLYAFCNSNGRVEPLPSWVGMA